jgi:hypothetical protein
MKVKGDNRRLIKLTVLYHLCPGLLLIFLLLAQGTSHANRQGKILLVSARDRIEGSFLGNHAVYADKDRIYLASFQGKLFVLARNRTDNFPLIEIVQDTTLPLTSVRGDAKNLYVASADGNLRIYRKGSRLSLINTVSPSNNGLSSLVLLGKNLYVGLGQAEIAADQDNIYLTSLNEGEFGLAIPKESLAVTLIYGKTFEQNHTVVFDRKSGVRLLSITNPSDLLGRLSAISLYTDKKIFVQSIAGCCGPGLFIYNKKTFKLEQKIDRTGANTVVRSGRFLIEGNEGGQIGLYDISHNPASFISDVNLRQLTGHTGVEDIEIRALWIDEVDNLIFAASSWGNDQSRGPLLPSFFVLELVE